MKSAYRSQHRELREILVSKIDLINRVARNHQELVTDREDDFIMVLCPAFYNDKNMGAIEIWM